MLVALTRIMIFLGEPWSTSFGGQTLGRGVTRIFRGWKRPGVDPGFLVRGDDGEALGL